MKCISDICIKQPTPRLNVAIFVYHHQRNYHARNHHNRQNVKLRHARPAALPPRLHGLLHRHDILGNAAPLRETFATLRGTNNLQRFRDEGCPNCEEFLHLAGSQDQIESCTSQVFEGLITLANPAKSWVAKWQRLDGYVAGVYAIKVSGQLPDEMRSTLEEEYRIQYIPWVLHDGKTCGLFANVFIGEMAPRRRQIDRRA